MPAINVHISQRLERTGKEFLKGCPKYDKNETTLNRYPVYHREIQGMTRLQCG